ncbi:MAG: hypothetical protein RIB71_04810 [Imperialibacter sp.]
MKTIVLITLLSSFLFINWQPASVADKTMADEFIVEPSTLL